MALTFLSGTSLRECRKAYHKAQRPWSAATSRRFVSVRSAQSIDVALRRVPSGAGPPHSKQMLAPSRWLCYSFPQMSLEFALQYSCPLRADYSEQHLRQWGRLSSLYAKLTTGDTSAPSPDKIQWIERAGAEIERMQEATTICAHCPACLPLDAAGDGESVGCLGRINYPVEAQFEKFLADRVQLSLDTLDIDDQPRLLRILIDPESPFDGEATKELRRVVTDEGLRFFELRVPIVLSREGARLTTDNIFDLLAGFRSEDSDTTTYTRELPFEAAADYYDFLDLILRSELSQSEVVRLTSRSRNYTQFLRLLTAIEKAEALNTRVLID